MSRMIICCFPRNRDMRGEFPALTSLRRLESGDGTVDAQGALVNPWALVQFANGIHGVWDTNEGDAFLALSAAQRVGLRGWVGPNLMQALPTRVRVWMLDVLRSDTFDPLNPGAVYYKRLALCGLLDYFRVQDRQTSQRRRALYVAGGLRARWDPNNERLLDRRPVHTWQGSAVTVVDAGAGWHDNTLGSDESIGQDSESSGDVLTAEGAPLTGLPPRMR